MWENHHRSRGLHSAEPPTLLERAFHRLGWAVDRALIKPRNVRNRIQLEIALLRSAFNRGYAELKPGQFGYDRAQQIRAEFAERTRAQYAQERAESSAPSPSDRQVS